MYVCIVIISWISCTIFKTILRSLSLSLLLSPSLSLSYTLSLTFSLSLSHSQSSVHAAWWYGVFNLLFFLMDTFTHIPYNAIGPELSESSIDR